MYQSHNSIVSPPSLEEIGDGAFSYSGLAVLDLSGTNVTKIRNKADGCTGLTTALFQVSLNEIEDEAFSVSGLTSLNLALVSQKSARSF